MLERNYPIAENILQTGKNVISIKITNVAGAAGIYGGHRVGLIRGGEIVVDLSGCWKYKPAAIILNSKLYVFNHTHQFKDMPEKPKYRLIANTPTVLYNAMIAPLTNYKIRGFIWRDDAEPNLFNKAGLPASPFKY